MQLEFEGVYMNAEVSVNGQLLRLQPYGYTSFVVDITPYLAYGQENEVGVTANNTAQPNSRWYSGTGIYRHVWLRTGGSIHIPPWGVFVTTPVVDPDASVVQVATELASLSGSRGERRPAQQRAGRGGCYGGPGRNPAEETVRPAELCW